jgi:type I restriction enzyme M protein
VNKDSWDLSVSNPNRATDVDSRAPQEIAAEIERLDLQATEALQAIKGLL